MVATLTPFTFFSGLLVAVVEPLGASEFVTILLGVFRKGFGHQETIVDVEDFKARSLRIGVRHRDNDQGRRAQRVVGPLRALPGPLKQQSPTSQLSSMEQKQRATAFV